MQALWKIAPPMTWLLVTLASIALLCGFVLLSHARVRTRAYGDEWRGWTRRGALEWTVRGGVALLAAGGALWAITLDAPAWVIWIPGAGALLLAALEAAGRMRSRNPSRA